MINNQLKNDESKENVFSNIDIRLDDMLDSVHEAVYILDSEGKFVKLNKGVERITGLKAIEFIGLKPRDLVKMGVIDRSVSEIVFEKKERVTIVQKIRNNKTIKEIMVTSTPILDKLGNIKYIVANLRDMTELNFLKSECEKAKTLSNQYFLELKKHKKVKEKVIAESSEMQKVLELASRAAQVDSTILLEGESGVGKEVLAKFIHEMSNRSSESLISINCAALPENLLEAELFGYAAGAFTGSQPKGKMGLIELANNGTLFLDEINSLPISLQGKLLRAIETMEITRLGSTESRHINFRLVAATNKSLEELVERGLFRGDLYFRLKVIPICIPPLRKRREDIMALTLHFLEFFNKKYDRQKEISNEVFQLMESYNWTGNVRELKNLIERLVVMSINSIIDISDLPNEFLNISERFNDFEIQINKIIPLNILLDQAEKLLIKKAVKQHKTTRELAKVLGISQSSVVRKMQSLNENGN